MRGIGGSAVFVQNFIIFLLHVYFTEWDSNRIYLLSGKEHLTLPPLLKISGFFFVFCFFFFGGGGRNFFLNISLLFLHCKNVLLRTCVQS